MSPLPPPAFGIGAPLPAVPDRPVHEQVSRHSSIRPDHVAVHSGDTAVGYGVLDEWAGRIAARLTTSGVRPGDRVGVLVEASAASVAAVLGVLRAGAGYVPLDQAQPDRLMAGVLADAGARAAVVGPTGATRLAGLGIPLVRAQDAPGPSLPPVEVADDDVAYLIYTSGTTGEPKGVVVEHGQLAASTAARHAVYPGQVVFLLVSPLAFDSSVAGLWGTLTAGGTLVVATPDEVRDPEALLGLIRRHGVTRLLCVPSLYAVLLDTADRADDDPLSTVDTVVVAGETLPDELAARHHATRSGRLVNEYGPTEATVWASYHRCAPDTPVTIGGPIPGARLYVLDENREPLPAGTAGELYVGGAGVARGYHGRPDATAAAFLDDPFHPGGRMFRTGDLARWRTDGTLEFLGRRDHQVKIRGHRVELGAVEAVLRGAPGVREAVVLPDEERTRLTGYVLAGPDTDAGVVSRHAAGELPAAVVPGEIRVLAEFPRTVTGKVDRARLGATRREPAAARPVADDLTGKVVAAWAEVLKHDDIPTGMNFFELGGHSLAMFRLQDALERHTGTRPSVVALYRRTTVAAQVELIGGGADVEETGADARRERALRARAVRARRQHAGEKAG